MSKRNRTGETRMMTCDNCTKEIEGTDEVVSVPSDDPQDIYIFCSKECEHEFFTK